MTKEIEVNLTAIEQGRLAVLEDVVERGLQTFFEVGLALAEIRGERLYRETHATFEAYLQERWDLSRAHGYRMIEAAAVSKVVSPVGDRPANEAQARELAPLVRSDPDKAAELWAELRREHGNGVTAKVIRDKVRVLRVPVTPDLERHELSAKLPDLPPRELNALAASIRAFGLFEPIVLYMGQVLDGWQRYRACKLVGVEPRFTRYGDDDPFGYWLSVNFMRAHYTADELDAIEAALVEARLHEEGIA